MRKSFVILFYIAWLLWMPLIQAQDARLTEDPRCIRSVLSTLNPNISEHEQISVQASFQALRTITKLGDANFIWLLLGALMATGTNETVKLYKDIVNSGLKRDNTILKKIGYRWGESALDGANKRIFDAANTTFAIIAHRKNVLKSGLEICVRDVYLVTLCPQMYTQAITSWQQDCLLPSRLPNSLKETETCTPPRELCLIWQEPVAVEWNSFDAPHILMSIIADVVPTPDNGDCGFFSIGVPREELQKKCNEIGAVIDTMNIEEKLKKDLKSYFKDTLKDNFAWADIGTLTALGHIYDVNIFIWDKFSGEREYYDHDAQEMRPIIYDEKDLKKHKLSNENYLRALWKKDAPSIHVQKNGGHFSRMLPANASEDERRNANKLEQLTHNLKWEEPRMKEEYKQPTGNYRVFVSQNDILEFSNEKEDKEDLEFNTDESYFEPEWRTVNKETYDQLMKSHNTFTYDEEMFFSEIETRSKKSWYPEKKLDQQAYDSWYKSYTQAFWQAEGKWRTSFKP